MNATNVEEKIIRQLRSVTVVFGGQHHTGWLPSGAAEPPDTPTEYVLLDLEIVELAATSYLLQWRPSAGQSFTGPPYEGDTWHASLDDALDQAQLDFGVARASWS